MFNTVVGDALRCAGSTEQKNIVGSVVTGTHIGCNLENCSTTAPTFDGAYPYHLTSHLDCGTFTTSVTRDIGGEPRRAPYDCGADEYLP